ncbi:AraC family transcriptional regulator [Caldimonas taiwanensis]|uniref:AraC family transcriptional regulator n=1 Tax=Caldimonas taiwanensis TaxID=307483 RepID=UPI0009FEF81F
MRTDPFGIDMDGVRGHLAVAIAGHVGGAEDRATALPGLALFRRETTTEPCECRVEPAVVLVVQGMKQLLLGGKPYPYDGRQFLVTSLDVPAASQVLQASADRPCLGLVLKLDLRLLAELIAQSGWPAPRDKAADGSAMLGQVTPALLDAFARLVDLLDQDAASQAVLAPLIVREIHFRLLQSEAAARLWQIASVGTPGQRIARALEWLRSHYREPLRIADLAAQVQMSPSSLHEHFKQLTGMTPLQYQKWLRLTEARRLMFNERLGAAEAAFRVGYESASQFSREYSRLFGTSPRRDVERVTPRGQRAGTRTGTPVAPDLQIFTASTSSRSLRHWPGTG